MLNKVGNYRKKRTTVEPIRSAEHLRRIRELLKSKPRDLLLFVLGVNSGLRCKDLLNLRVWQVRGLAVNAVVRIVETKTKKTNFLVVNAAIHRQLAEFFSATPPLDRDEFLFRTKYGKRMTSIYAGRLVQSWCRAVGLVDGVYGCHTLRKSWGFLQRVRFKTDWSLITERYKHSSPAITRRYLCIQEHEITDLLERVIE